MFHDGIKPKLKETIPYFLLEQEVQIGEELGVAGFISDPTGSVSLLVSLLNGEYALADIIANMQSRFPEVTTEEVTHAIVLMDEAGYLEDASIRPEKMNSYETERYKANLNYFSLFTPISGNKYSVQERINEAKIALLGVGGLGSQILYHLSALGFHNIKALDFDKLDISNFNRQLLYSEADLGAYKIEMAKQRIEQFNPNVNLQITNKKIESSEDVLRHIEGTEFVVCVADRPTLDIQNWVNEAVVKAGLPMVSGGVLNTRGRFFTMIPSETGCVRCHSDQLRDGGSNQGRALLDYMRSIDFQRKNAAISSNVAMLAGMIVSELLKLVTGFEKPTALGRVMEFNFRSYTISELSSWKRNEECPVCGTHAVVRV